MNGLAASLSEALGLAAGLNGASIGADVMLCPPATLIAAMSQAMAGSAVQVGAQDCHNAVAGAHTGDLSAEMLRDAGARAIIVGHSERRADHGERDQDVAAKASAAWRTGMTAIICVGETDGQRASGLTLDVVGRQLRASVPDGASAANAVIAYEPVWAIGTGLTPTLGDVAEVHASIRAALQARLGLAEGSAVRILYGGSVKPANASELMGIANVDGALVGGASLKAADLLGIVAAYR